MKRLLFYYLSTLCVIIIVLLVVFGYIMCVTGFWLLIFLLLVYPVYKILRGWK